MTGNWQLLVIMTFTNQPLFHHNQPFTSSFDGSQPCWLTRMLAACAFNCFRKGIIIMFATLHGAPKVVIFYRMAVRFSLYFS